MVHELLAAAQAVDPTTLPLWAVVVLAAGMYPLGIMLGSFCSPCCCGCEEGAGLPEALAVSFAGLTKGVTKFDDLLSVKISACFGSGATATVAAPSGKVEAFVVEDDGPLSSVTLTSGGAGYAQIGRVAPVGLTVAGGSGSGAEFSVSVSPADPDNCGRPLWQIDSVKVTKAGTGYVHDEELTVYLGTDEFEYLPAVLKLQTVAIEPTLSAAASSVNGDGAIFGVVMEQIQTSPNRWGVGEVTLEEPGDGYQDGDQIVFTVDDGTEVLAASAVIACVHVEPDLEVEVFGPGSGAEFSFTLEQFEQYGRDYWSVATLTPTAAGSGYSNGATLRVKAQFGSSDDPQSLWTIQTNGSGGITGATRTTPGRFWKNTGVIDFVEVTSAGSYYKTSPDTDAVVVQAGGRFYKTDSTAPTLVADVTVEIVQTWPSQGSGEVITAEVDNDIESPTFGQIVALTLENGGDGFLSWAYELLACCIANWNGKTVIAKRSSTEPCVYEKDCCQLGTVRVRYNGQNEPPSAKIYQGCGVEFEVTTEPPYTCDSLSFEGVDLFGTGTISVSPAPAGFDEENYPCPGCCTGTPDEPLFNTACTEEDCMAAGGTWWDVCACGPCLLNNCEGYELVVELTVELNPAYVPAGGQATFTRTLTLSALGGFSAESNDGGVYALANTLTTGGLFGCAVFASVDVPANIITGTINAITRSSSCLEPGFVYLPSEVIDVEGTACPIDGAVQFCGHIGTMVPGVFGPQQAASLLTTVTVITP